jgi:2-polyprenyl-3-methyl-5-hydroxy-6-metoxy-1,4-benzoquinol methylase
MDDPGCDPQLLARTFAHFKIINRTLTRRELVARRYILPLARLRAGQSCRIVDLGSGAGDFALWLALRLRREGITAEIICLDSDPRAVHYATQACRHERTIRCSQADILSANIASFQPHIIHANHVLHHLDDPHIHQLLRAVDNAAELGYVLNDTVRSPVAYAAYLLVASLLFRGSFARADGLLSIRKGFTRAEMAQHIRSAGIDGRAEVHAVWPGRIVVACAPERR